MCPRDRIKLTVRQPIAGWLLDKTKKGSQEIPVNPSKYLVAGGGFEPPTFGL
jgi:hypothetical protein